MIDVRPGLDQLHLYDGEEADFPVKLDANERPMEIPAKIKMRIAEAINWLPFHRYPEMSASTLREQIAVRFQRTREQVLIGNGSSELLQAICHTFGGPERPIVFPSPSFSMYSIYARLADSPARSVPLGPDFELDPQRVIDTARRSGAKLILLCNPNNPTGAAMPLADIEFILQNVSCPVVVDEAYTDFHGETAVTFLDQYPNLIITRTFSKAFGLASARVGYMLASREIAAPVEKCLLPYRVNAFSLTAAQIVFEHQDEFAADIQKICSQRDRLVADLNAMPGIAVFPSRTNFVLFQMDRAEELAAELARQGIGVRHFGSAPGLENCIRVTVGTPAENEIFRTAVSLFLQDAEQGAK